MVICLKCKSLDSSCVTCLGKGKISLMHSELFDLGFVECDDSMMYRLVLSKVLDKDSTITIELERLNCEFKIVHLDYNGPRDNVNNESIPSVGKLVEFLYSY